MRSETIASVPTGVGTGVGTGIGTDIGTVVLTSIVSFADKHVGPHRVVIGYWAVSFNTPTTHDKKTLDKKN